LVHVTKTSDLPSRAIAEDASIELGATPGKSKSVWVRVGTVAALLLLGACVGAITALGLATANIDNWAQWARDFAKSPGPAAFVALVAAVIAYLGISKQARIARDALSHQQRAAKSDSWWEVFQWASGRAVPERKDDVSLPDEVTIDTLKRLALEATTDVQQTACAGMIDFLARRSLQEVRAENGSGFDGESDAQDATENALARYVSATQGTPAASAMAEARVYEARVISAVRSIVHKLPGGSLVAGSGPMSPDATVLVAGETILVEVRWGGERIKARRSVLRYVERNRSSGTTAPILFVSPWRDVLLAPEAEVLRVVTVQWTGPEDNDALLKGLSMARTMAADGQIPIPSDQHP
jgi:hypothetical protein